MTSLGEGLTSSWLDSPVELEESSTELHLLNVHLSSDSQESEARSASGPKVWNHGQRFDGLLFGLWMLTLQIELTLGQLSLTALGVGKGKPEDPA